MGSIEGQWSKRALKVENPKRFSISASFNSAGVQEFIVAPAWPKDPECGLLFDIKARGKCVVVVSHFETVPFE